MKIFNLDDPDDSGCDIQIIDLDLDLPFDEADNNGVSIFIPGPPGPQGPPGTSSLALKAGVIAGGSFSGSPKKYSIVFATAFIDTAYGIALTGTDGRSYTYESKTASGFIINANANTAISGEVSWMATASGET